MKSFARLFAILCLPWFGPVLGQDWMPEQLEVWSAVEKLVEDFYAGDVDNLNRHPDFVFWNAENPAPGDKRAAALQDEALFGSGIKFHDASVTPLTISVHGEFATVNAYIRVFQVLPGQESPTSITARFHSDWKKQGDTWFNVSNFLYREK